MSAKKERSSHPPSKLALYDALVAKIPGLIRKGATLPYTSVNGNMFSYLGKDGVFALRLPEDAREDFLVRYNTTLRDVYGIVQEEYVVVPDALLADTEELWPYLDLSHQYARSLKPKLPSKSKKPAK